SSNRSRDTIGSHINIRVFGVLRVGTGGVAASQHGDSHDTGQHQGSNFLELHNEFSSLWCIKDRDPKQVERKVLSFQRHYSIPPRCQGPIYYFLVFAFFSLLWVEA